MRHGFIGIDDGPYVFQNPVVKRGLTAQGVVWAFTSFYAGNWHPLTWLSHMLDCQIYGLDPAWHHLTNLLFHTANTLLLYRLLRRMTGCVGRSALVAALFCLHPLHVESVAWIAERKDVLSAFFFILAVWAYVLYVDVRSHKTYFLVTALLIFGLMAKPMLVTVPFLLLLLDYWPLGRYRAGSGTPFNRFRGGWLPLVREKLPWFAIVTISSVVTYSAQLKGEAVTPFAQLPLLPRIANAVTSYVSYIQLTIWPSHLAILYPYHTGGIPGWRVFFSVLLLACVTGLVMWQAPKRGFLLTGWLWYLGMLVPVIGVIQVGSQALADRYAYLPLVGLFVMLAWGLGQMADRWPTQRVAFLAIPIAALFFLGTRAHSQAGFWRDNVTLYEHTLTVAPDNPIILLNLGSEFASQQRLDAAITYYQQALCFDPKSGRIHAALGTALARKGENENAMQHLTQAVRLDPNLSAAYNSIGVLLLSQNKVSEAIPFLRDAVRIDSNNAEAHNTLGAALLFQGKIPEAIEEFSAALRIRPEFTEAQNNLKTAMSGRPSPGKR
jgi:tetratricopeptide (TPR) repeat protein